MLPNFAIGLRKVVSLTFRSLYLWGNGSCYTLNSRLGEPQEGVGLSGEEISCLRRELSTFRLRSTRKQVTMPS